MSKPYAIRSREFGRGAAETRRFSTLKGAAKYIQERWQGAEYMDGRAAFHTDYCTYELVGFTLADVGAVGFESDGCPTFRFKPEFGAPATAAQPAHPEYD